MALRSQGELGKAVSKGIKSEGRDAIQAQAVAQKGVRVAVVLGRSKPRVAQGL